MVIIMILIMIPITIMIDSDNDNNNDNDNDNSNDSDSQIVTVIMIIIVKTIMIIIEQNSVQGGHYAKGLIYHRPIYQLPKLASLSARPIPRENIFYNDGDNDSNSDKDNDDDSDNGNGNDSDIKQFSLSEQPLITAFGKLSHGKRDFAKAEGRKTENGEGDTRRRRGGGRVKKYNPTKNGVIT